MQDEMYVYTLFFFVCSVGIKKFCPKIGVDTRKKLETPDNYFTSFTLLSHLPFSRKNVLVFMATEENKTSENPKQAFLAYFPMLTETQKS